VNLLDRKLVRDIAALRGQVITIALVVAAGVAVFVASVSTFSSLRSACESFYAETRFPQIFVTLKRAPLSVVARLGEIPGVVAVEPRIVRDVRPHRTYRFRRGSFRSRGPEMKISPGCTCAAGSRRPRTTLAMQRSTRPSRK
jgi:hypothetical protein